MNIIRFYKVVSNRLQQSDTSLACRSIGRKSSYFTSSTSKLRELSGGDCGSSRNITTSPNITKYMADDKSWRRAYLAVGSNLGDRYQNIADALSSLISNNPSTIRLIRTSYLRMTAPMYVTDQPEFLNGAVEVETSLSPLELLRSLKRIEAELGRDIGPNSTAIRFGPRPVDLDILLFDEHEAGHSNTTTTLDTMPVPLIMQTEELEIPHPRMSEREFVLSPMADFEGSDRNITHPVSNKTMSELLRYLRSHSNDKVTTNRADHPAVRVLPLPKGRMLHFNKTIIMGILNVTPDSFSDGGRYDSKSSGEASALHHAMQLVRDGADIIDIGGESTRPGAVEVAMQEELERVIPIIQRIRMETEQPLLSNVPISIDTRNSKVARAAILAGADIVNDVSGGTHDPEMLATVASLGVPMIIMHMRGNPKTMQSMTDYSSVQDGGGEGTHSGVVSVVARELMQRSAAAEAAGIPRWLQIVDPGIGFAKDMHGNVSLLKGVNTLRGYCDNLPLLIGPSRKGFIGKITGETNPEERDYGTIAACLASIQTLSSDEYGLDGACNILRVHNVKAVKHALVVYDAIRSAE
jgi:dihydropteroate synthase/2-amino-4-hydroxy-6-hydroxymethyldihydropteridine diphosphokinase